MFEHNDIPVKACFSPFRSQVTASHSGNYCWNSEQQAMAGLLIVQVLLLKLSHPTTNSTPTVILVWVSLAYFFTEFFFLPGLALKFICFPYIDLVQGWIKRVQCDPLQCLFITSNVICFPGFLFHA
jgi:hypothetical protein